MFAPTSRYANLPVAQLVVLDPDGRPRAIRYVARRFVPQDTGTAALVVHRVVQGERLDNVTARYLGDPTQFWRICDVNGALRPEELVEVPGRELTIALPDLSRP